MNQRDQIIHISEEELMSQKDKLSFSRQTARKSRAVAKPVEEAEAPAAAAATEDKKESRTSGADIDILVD